MSEKLRILLFALSVTLILILMVDVVGTYSYFTDEDEAVNTFTVGDVDITLEETTGDKYKMIPGITLAKDPVVTVKGGSVDCWVFVEVIDEEKIFNKVSYKASAFLDYSITTKDDRESPWNKLPGQANVYYCKVPKSSTDVKLPCILDHEKVIVKDTVTEEMMQDVLKENEDATTKKYPELTFKAYAFQYNKGEDNTGKDIYFTPEEAWAQLNPPAESGE